ncbi:hypothetical protein SARC_10855 [Sphaeroforma arctica JP610]|uniref:SET domain-containing protein n=1 Tax=Sphaeroforma arctica JP610 TaxID=667725 RepID=A0A0L0FIP9_9EUKA|nr:hypothetical protein SARC_10855 [Sphaeroforma arctica JP610]KNC76652.1 hypothetical protein SARC_10855 [Sphaeroforma arctica JP610]|eukprot:XP_014150554.1 hypothetical protein SARC_10855 [Sphaeroforma arctica JP610]
MYSGEGEPHLTEKIVGCPLECGNVYCSKKCRDADQNEHGHSLLCVGQIDSLDHPLYQFKVHSLTTQEEFLLAAKALAVMMGVLWAADEDEQGGTLAQSLLKPYAHFQSGVWWDLAGGQEMAGVLQAQATEAFQLLQAAWSDLGHLPENTHGIMSMDTFNRLLSIFHLNNVGVRRVSPISRYMKMPPFYLYRNKSLVYYEQIASQLSDAATQDEIFDTLMSHVDPILMGDGCDDSDCDDSDCDDRESESESESEGEASSESGMESGTTSKPEIPDNSGTDSAIEPSACNDANDGDVEEEEEEQQQQQQQQQGEEGEEEDDDDEEEEEVTAAMTLGDWGDADIEAGESLFPMFDGCGLFPLISAINHSCEPNCKVTYGTTGRGKLALELRSLCSINSDTEITISYTATDLPAEERQEILGKYGFRCNCTKCQRGD